MCLKACKRVNERMGDIQKNVGLWICDGWMGACVVADRQSNKRSSFIFLLSERDEQSGGDSGCYSPPSPLCFSYLFGIHRYRFRLEICMQG